MFLPSTKRWQTFFSGNMVTYRQRWRRHFSPAKKPQFWKCPALWHLNTQSHSLHPHFGNCAVTFTAHNSGSRNFEFAIWRVDASLTHPSNSLCRARVPADLWARLCEFSDLRHKKFTCTHLAESVALLTGLKLIHTLFAHFLDGAFTLLVYCIFHDIYFYSVTFSSSWGE